MARDDFDLELEEDGDEVEEEEEEERRVLRRRPRSIFEISKEDLIIIMLTLFGGILVGWYASKMMRKDESQHHHYSPFPHLNQPAFIPEPPEKEDIRAATPVAREYKKSKLKKHRGYYVDHEGNAMLESPAQFENWVVKRDLEGNIIDTYKVQGSDWLT